MLVMVTWIIVCWSGNARAENRGEELLKKLDETMALAKDQHFQYHLVTQEPGKEKREQVMDVKIKGSKKRLVEFLSPGDIKGMKILVLSRNKMYVYLPAYRKVRRVASHAKDQGFMGTTYSHDDISTAVYSEAYIAKLLRETDTHWVVEAIRKPGAGGTYAKLEFDLTKKYIHPDEIRFFNDKGVKIKTEHRIGYSCQGKVCNARVMKMTDHVRNDAWTKMERTKWEVNTGPSDRLFTMRNLQR